MWSGTGEGLRKRRRKQNRVCGNEVVSCPGGHFIGIWVHESNWYLVSRVHFCRVAGSDGSVSWQGLPWADLAHHRHSGHSNDARHFVHNKRGRSQIYKKFTEADKAEPAKPLPRQQSLCPWSAAENAHIQPEHEIHRRAVPGAPLLWAAAQRRRWAGQLEKVRLVLGQFWADQRKASNTRLPGVTSIPQVTAPSRCQLAFQNLRDRAELKPKSSAATLSHSLLLIEYFLGKKLKRKKESKSRVLC